MSRFRAFLFRLRGLVRGRTIEAEMNAELQAHLEGLIARNLAAGMSPEDARHAALRAFGGVAQIAERARDERRSTRIDQLIQDGRFAFRAMVRARGFTVGLVSTLTL